MEPIQVLFYTLGSVAALWYILDNMKSSYIRNKKKHLTRITDEFHEKMEEYEEYLTPRFEIWWSNNHPDIEEDESVGLSIGHGFAQFFTGHDNITKEMSLRFAVLTYGAKEFDAIAAKLKKVHTELYQSFTSAHESKVTTLRRELLDAGVNITLLEEEFASP